MVTVLFSIVSRNKNISPPFTVLYNFLATTCGSVETGISVKSIWSLAAESLISLDSGPALLSWPYLFTNVTLYLYLEFILMNLVWKLN